MSMSPLLRWAGIVVVALAVVGSAWWLRQYVAATQPPPPPLAPMRPRATVPPLPPRASGGSFDYESGEAGMVEGSDLTSSTPRVGARAGASGRAAGPEGSAASRPLAAGTIIPATPSATEPERSAAKGGVALSVTFDGSAASSEDDPPMVQEGVQFDARSEAALFPPASYLAYSDLAGIDPEQGTIAFWLRRETDPEDGKPRGLLMARVNTWQNRLELGMGPSYIRFMLTTNDGIETPVGCGIRFGKGEWHHIAVAWGDALAVLYINGSPCDQRTFGSSLVLPRGTPLWIGGQPTTANPDEAPISLRTLIVLDHPVTDEEIAAMLAQQPAP
jgi:hypothetical protein